jgi:hypothetical protein
VCNRKKLVFAVVVLELDGKIRSSLSTLTVTSGKNLNSNQKKPLFLRFYTNVIIVWTSHLVLSHDPTQHINFSPFTRKKEEEETSKTKENLSRRD